MVSKLIVVSYCFFFTLTLEKKKNTRPQAPDSWHLDFFFSGFDDKTVGVARQGCV